MRPTWGYLFFYLSQGQARECEIEKSLGSARMVFTVRKKEFVA